MDNTLPFYSLQGLCCIIHRDPEQIANPGPDFQVQPGDILYLWGVPERVEEARHRAGSRAEDDGDP